MSEAPRFGTRKFDADFVDEIFGGVNYKDPVAIDGESIAGGRIRSIFALNSDSGELWRCADVTFVTDQGDNIFSNRRFILVRELDGDINFKIEFDVDMGHAFLPEEMSSEEVSRAMDISNQGIAAIKRFGSPEPPY